MSIGTFGSFTQARLAIYAAQTGLTVTGNNISNINTEGYTRQRVDQSSLHTAGSDRYYAEGDIRVGQGVLVRSISQIRSPFLDIRFRRENASVGYTDTRLDNLNRIADILDEVGKGDASKDEDGFGILGLELDKIRDALEQLIDQTGHQEYDNTVRASADALAKKFNTYAEALKREYDNTVMQLHDDVDEVNGILRTIRELNEEIRKCDIHGDNALELRDERNLQIDKLSNLINIEVDYSMEEFSYGVEIEKLSIRLGNSNPDGGVETDSSLLIDGVYGAELILEQVPQPNPDAEYDPNNRDTWPYLHKDTGKPTSSLANAKKDADGNPVANPNYKPYLTPEGKPTADPAEANMVDSPNFNITVSELRNRAGRIYYVTTKSPEVQIDPANTAEIEAAKEAIAKEGGSITEKNTPTESDITITTYRASAVGNPNWARYKPYLDADGKPVGDIKDAALENGVPKPNPAHYPYMDAEGKTFSMTKGENYKDNPAYEARYLKEGGGSTNSVAEAKKDYFKEIYVRTASKPVELDDNDLYGKLQAHREMLTEAGEFTDTAVITKESGQTGPYRCADENAASKRGIIYYQKALDLLANQFANAFNEANQGYRVDPNGNYITGTVTDKQTDVVKLPSGAALNQKTSWDKLAAADQAELENATGLTYQKDPKTGKDNLKEIVNAYLAGQKYDANGNPTVTDPKARGVFDGGVLFSNHNSGDDPTNITASNITISHTWSNTNLLVRSFECPPGKTEPASGQSDNLLHFIGLWDEKMDYIPNVLPDTGKASGAVMFNGNFSEMWNKIGGTLGEDRKETETMLNVHYESALEIDTNRDSVSAVDFNDEAMNLMMYAKSYNAACRLMTTLDSVIDKLVNNTGLTT